MTTAQLNALEAYAAAVTALVDAIPEEAATPEVIAAVRNVGNALHDVAATFRGPKLSLVP